MFIIINIILRSLSFSRFVDLRTVWYLFFFLENQENYYFICIQSQCHRKIFEDRWKSKKTNIFPYIHQYLNTLEKYETSLRIDETFGGMEHQVQLENFMVGRLAEFQGRNGNDRNSFCRVSLFLRSSTILSHQVRIRRHKFLRETGRDTRAWWRWAWTDCRGNRIRGRYREIDNRSFYGDSRYSLSIVKLGFLFG